MSCVSSSFIFNSSSPQVLLQYAVNEEEVDVGEG